MITMGLLNFFREKIEDEMHSAELFYGAGDVEAGQKHENKAREWQGKLKAATEDPEAAKPWWLR